MYPQKQNPPSFFFFFFLLLPFCLLLLLAFPHSCFGGSSYPQNRHGNNNYPLSGAYNYRFHGSLNVGYHDNNHHHSDSSRHSNYNSRPSPPASTKRSPTAVARVNNNNNVVNVDKFGARGDGRSDDTLAFGKAWKVACASTGPTLFAVPKNKVYTLKPITFSGPCRADLSVQIFGTIRASQNFNDYKKDRKHWIQFENLQNFRVRGGGTIDGNGQVWWKNSCKVNNKLPCQDAPTGVTFNECKNLIVSNLRFRNSQKMHVSFQKCTNVRVLHLLVTAPGDSPNTDGIHVTGTQNIRISQSVIKTGDDCISIVSGSKNVQATDITCGPGHGISIGSLGAGNGEAEVSDVFVNRATLSGTTNGVRIKTWQGGSGYARNIQFQNIVMNNVTNPIIIDQDYCDQNDPCHQQTSAVQVSNVMYKNIRGTSSSKVAINLKCSKSVPCEGIVLEDVSLKAASEEDSMKDGPQASCVSVELTRRGKVTPLCSSD